MLLFDHWFLESDNPFGSFRRHFLTLVQGNFSLERKCYRDYFLFLFYRRKTWSYSGLNLNFASIFKITFHISSVKMRRFKEFLKASVKKILFGETLITCKSYSSIFKLRKRENSSGGNDHYLFLQTKLLSNKPSQNLKLSSVANFQKSPIFIWKVILVNRDVF